MNYSLSDIPDKKERDKSLLLVEKLFLVLDKEIRRSNLFAAMLSGLTTFVAGSIPIVAFVALPSPFNTIVSLAVVAVSFRCLSWCVIAQEKPACTGK